MAADAFLLESEGSGVGGGSLLDAAVHALVRPAHRDLRRAGVGGRRRQRRALGVQLKAPAPDRVGVVGDGCSQELLGQQQRLVPGRLVPGRPVPGQLAPGQRLIGQEVEERPARGRAHPRASG